MRLRKITLDIWLSEVKVKHENKYSYLNVVEYKNANSMMLITCPEHGDFEQKAWLHAKGRGCPVCRYQTPKMGGRIQEPEMLKRFKEKHGSFYDYSNVAYTTIDTKVLIGCPVHGQFWQTPRNHMDGHRCKSCANGNTSRPEQTWITNFNNPAIIQNHRIILPDGSLIIVDGYDPTTNTIYEFWGSFWHGDPTKFNANNVNQLNGKTFGELYDATLEKSSKIRAFGFNLVEMWESDYRRLKNLR
jgi:hypothetical protein